MPKYRILETSFIDNRLVRPGDEIETNDTPAAHWEPMDKAAAKASDKAAAEEAARAEAARKEAEAHAAKDSPAALPVAPAQEQARIEAEVAAAAAAAATNNQADPLV